MTRMTGLMIFLLSGIFSAPALACDPAPNYSIAIEISQAPNCLEFSDVASYSAFAISVNNTCEYSVVVEPADCVECDGPTEVRAGERRELIVEATKATGTRQVVWLTDEDTGFVTLELTYRDNSRACDGWENDGLGCQQAGPGNMLIGLLFILGWIGTRRILASDV